MCAKGLLGVIASLALTTACERRERTQNADTRSSDVSGASGASRAPAPLRAADPPNRAPPIVIPPSILRPAAAPPTAQARADADKFFMRTCAVCHGREGLGNGPGAGGLEIPPRNYTDTIWQASVTDERIKRTILGGGASVGKDAAMPAHPQLLGKPDVLDALVLKIRAFDAGSGRGSLDAGDASATEPLDR